MYSRKIKKMVEYFIAWWNVENLFDIETAERPPKLRDILKHELKRLDSGVTRSKN